VRHEEKLWSSSRLRRESLVVQRGDDRLSSSCRRDDKVSVPIVDLALNIERLKHLRLVRVGANLKTRQAECDAVRVTGTTSLRQRIIEAIPIRRRIV